MLRRRLRLLAGVVLAALLGGVFTPLFGDLHAESDVACVDDLLWAPSHHTTTQIENVRPPVSDGHCAVCHLQRAMNGAADDAKRFVVASVAVTPHPAIAEHPVRSHARLDIPSRAPPSFL